MKIHTLHLSSYGKFKDKTISFEDGINYIYGKNEAGKTTLMAFIKAMLYGFSGRGADGDRKRYMPWDGGRLSGEMTVTLADGRRVIISRTSGRTPAQDEFRVLDAVTGEECTVDLAAEIGIGENAFLKTVFIRQMSSDVDGGDEELTDKLINLAGSGDAETGYEEAMDFLRDSMRLYKHQRGDGGKINDLKKQITALSDELEKAEEENRNYLRYIAEEKALRLEIDGLLKQAAAAAAEIRAVEAGIANRAVAAAKNKLASALAEKEEAAELLQVVEEKRNSFAAFANAISDSVYAPPENPEPLKKQSHIISRNLRLCMIGAGLAGIAGILFAVFGKLPTGCAFLAAALLLIVCGLRQNQTKKAIAENLSGIEKNEEARARALAAFNCASLKEYTEKRAEKLALDEKWAALSEKHMRLSGLVKAAEADVIALSQAANAFADVIPSDKDPKEAEEAEARTEKRLEEKLRRAATIEGILKAGREGKRTADMIQTERACLAEHLAEAEETYAALSLASETLEAVFAELSRDFTPRINEKASHYLSVLTGREEEKLLLDKKYAVTMGRSEHKPLKFFSGGTMDQAFFAVRLAIAELVLADKNVPIFLDDSFLQYDEVREENAISLLRHIAKNKQVFWFSCRKRETEDINSIEL